MKKDWTILGMQTDTEIKERSPEAERYCATPSPKASSGVLRHLWSRKDCSKLEIAATQQERLWRDCIGELVLCWICVMAMREILVYSCQDSERNCREFVSSQWERLLHIFVRTLEEIVARLHFRAIFPRSDSLFASPKQPQERSRRSIPSLARSCLEFKWSLTKNPSSGYFLYIFVKAPCLICFLQWSQNPSQDWRIRLTAKEEAENVWSQLCMHRERTADLP